MYRLESIASANTIGPDKAAELLTFNTFEGQRPLSRLHVAKLVQLMEGGKFVKASISVAKNGDGNNVLMNGQHQLHAIQQFGKPIKATIDYYSIEEPHDLANLFATFDVNRLRTQSHILYAARPLMKNELLREMPMHFLSQCGSAYMVLKSGKPIFRGGGGSQTPLPTERSEAIEANAKEIVRLYSFVNENGALEVLTVGIVVAVLLCLRANQSKAEEFWAPVLSSAGLEKGSPQWKLNKSLLGMKRKSSSGWTRQFADCAYGIAWWNSWRTGEKRVEVGAGRMSEIPKVEK